MKAQQVAINLVTLAKAPIDQLLSACAQAGFHNIEFQLGNLKRWMKESSLSAADVRKMLDKHGQRCIGGFETHLAVFDEATMDDNHAMLAANARLLGDLGGGVLVVGTDGPPKPNIDALDTVGRMMRRMIDLCPSAVSLAVEFNWSPLVKSLRSALRVVKAADHPRVGILFDPAHYHCTSTKMEDLTAEAVGKILHVHVDDMADKPGEHSHCNADRRLPLEGILPLKRMLGRIEELGYRGFFSLEMFSEELWALPPAQAAGRCHAAMQRLL